MRSAAVSLLLLVCAAPPLRAGWIPGWQGKATLSAGWRFTDVDGAEAKYREDVNVHPGPVLFGLTVDGRAAQPTTSWLDRVHLAVERPGNEPVQRYALSFADDPRFSFRARFTRARYFYAVPQLWEASVDGNGRLDDLHDWNFVRTTGSVDLRVRPVATGPSLFAGYRLVQRDGRAVSSVLVPAGDVFLLQAPIDDVTHVGRLGATGRTLGADWHVEQQFRRIERDRVLHDVLTPDGLDPTDGTTLDLLRRTQREHVDMPVTIARVERAVGDWLALEAGYTYAHASLGGTRTLAQRGTSDVPGFDRRTARSTLDGRLDAHVADAGVTVAVLPRVRLHADYRFDERHARGDLLERGTFGRVSTRTGTALRAHRTTFELDLDPRDDLDLQFGARLARRDTRDPRNGIDVSTDDIGAIGRVRYRPWRPVEFFGRYESVQIDDPITIAADPTRPPPLPGRETTLTVRNRGVAGTTLRPAEWCTLRWQLTVDRRENDSFGASVNALGHAGTVTIGPIAGVTAQGTLAQRDLESRADVVPGPRFVRQTSVQDGSEVVAQGSLRWEFTLWKQPLTLGGDLAWVRADNRLRPQLERDASGAAVYDLERLDGSVSLTWRHRWVEPAIEVRRVDYDERRRGRNDYAATIVVLKLTKQLEF